MTLIRDNEMKQFVQKVSQALLFQLLNNITFSYEEMETFSLACQTHLVGWSLLEMINDPEYKSQ